MIVFVLGFRATYNLVGNELVKKSLEESRLFLNEGEKNLLFLRSTELKIHYRFPRFDSNILR